MKNKILIRPMAYLITGSCSIPIYCSSMVFVVRSRFISSGNLCPKVSVLVNIKCLLTLIKQLYILIWFSILA